MARSQQSEITGSNGIRQVTGSGVLLAQSRRRHRSDRRLYLVGLPGARHRCPADWARANLRRHFEVDRYYIAHAAIDALAGDGKMTAKDVIG